MAKLFDTKMYEEYAARHGLEKPDCCLLHAEVKDGEGDTVMIGDGYVFMNVIAQMVATLSIRNRIPIHRLCMDIAKGAERMKNNKS